MALSAEDLVYFSVSKARTPGNNPDIAFADCTQT